MILVIDDGRVAEFAPPRELLQDSNSLFATMAASQGLRLEDVDVTEAHARSNIAVE